MEREYISMLMEIGFRESSRKVKDGGMGSLPGLMGDCKLENGLRTSSKYDLSEGYHV